MERLSVDNFKKDKITFTEWPSVNTSNLVVDCLNAVQTIHCALEHSDLNIYYQNEKLHDIFYKKFGVYSSNYDNINYLHALGYSDFTSTIRFSSDPNQSMSKLISNMVPYPRLHFAPFQMAPLYEPDDMIVEHHDVDQLLMEAYDDDNKFCVSSHNECLEMKQEDYMSKFSYNLGCSYTFRGNFVHAEKADIQNLVNSHYPNILQ